MPSRKEMAFLFFLKKIPATNHLILRGISVIMF